MLNYWLFCCFICFMGSEAFANVVLMGNNVTLSFDAIEANFAPTVKGSGECGTLFLAEPLDGCAPLTNSSLENTSINAPFVLIVRGRCSFEDKVRAAQSAGYKAAVIYNNDESDLVAMAGNSAGIKIHAVFVSKSSGLKLLEYTNSPSIKAWIIPSYENPAWSIMAVSFISLLALSAVLATCFFVRRHRIIRRERPQPSRVREFHGMSTRLVKAMPSLVFTTVLEDNCTSATCAICLEDYDVGDRLRILPCRHKFHTICVDAWLTSWRTFCPVCKRDARTITGEHPPSERTPLLSPSPSSSLLSSVISSSYASSRAIQINHSVSTTPHNHRYLSPTRNSLDVRTVTSSSHRSRPSQLVSSNSLGYPLLSPHNSRYTSSYSYYPSPGNAIWSPRQQPRHNDSVSSFSPYDSANSLPDC